MGPVYVNGVNTPYLPGVSAQIVEALQRKVLPYRFLFVVCLLDGTGESS